MLTQAHLENYYPLRYTEALQPRSKRTWLLLKHVEGPGIEHMMLGLGVC